MDDSEDIVQDNDRSSMCVMVNEENGDDGGESNTVLSSDSEGQKE